MVVVTCGASKMPMAVVAVDSNIGEQARRAGHAIATRLVTDVRYVTSTCFVATFTHVLTSHGTSKICDHVMSFDTSYSRLSLLAESTCPSNMNLPQFRQW